ncbi:MAG TPA: glycosyltransferase, partial [Planctomycetota bacterium]|nr:glycosyltransferase [Planctomycetota bacterium]
MRIAFVTARFRPDSPKGHDQHTVSLVKALKLLGLEVEVFAPRDIAGLHPLAQRREEWHGVGVTWLHGGEQASPVEWAQALDAFFERESPDVVHFDTMVGDGIALAEVVRTRGLASLVHLNDYRTLGQDARALGADLVPYDAEDMEARARGLLVDRLLDQHPGLGRHGGHLIPELVEPPFWEHLQALLHGPEAEGLEAARDEVQTYRERSARAFESWSARFANSRWLSAYFEEVLGTSVDGLLPGVERSTFAGLVPPRAGRGPVRFGFVGEMDKASGALLLLDAFAGLDGRAELRLFGSGDDRLFMRILRGHAQEVGARWYGAPEAGTRAQIFDRIDVLVVPSLWAESAPYEVLEALAARRPVIVCDLEPTCEAVEHGQTGWHFAAGDVGALRAAMLRFVEQPELLQQFEANIPIPRDITEEAREWADAYAVAIATKASSTLEAQAPPHLEALAERYHELQRLPTRELFEKVVGGLMGLSARMGVELDPAEALVRAVAAGGPGRDVRLAYERIHEWLEGHAEDLKLGRQQLLEQEAHLRREREQVQEREQSMT